MFRVTAAAVMPFDLFSFVDFSLEIRLLVRAPLNLTDDGRMDLLVLFLEHQVVIAYLADRELLSPSAVKIVLAVWHIVNVVAILLLLVEGRSRSAIKLED